MSIATNVFIATGDALAVIRPDGPRWTAELRLVGMPTQCIAVDPLQSRRLYCGTFGQGLWMSDDAGASWQRAGQGIPHAEVMAVAASPLERRGDYGVVWAGTEPSALYRSEDGGQTWQERPALRELPSAPTWSFPPRPWTSHVRWIAPDPTEAGRLFVGIELGGVMRSLDGGVTWEDRKPDSQHDAHTLAVHRLAPGRVYEAAGGGYAESHDGGATWRRHDEGLTRRYVWGLAIDPADSQTLVVSAAHGPRQAHDRAAAETALYRREGDGPWHELHDGLPAPRGTRAYVLATNEAEPHVFYAASPEAGLLRSSDAGRSWQRLDVVWPAGYQLSETRGLAVVSL